MTTRRADIICDCQQCGEKFAVPAPQYDARVRAGYPPRYCSRACMGMSWRTKPRETRVCQHCGEEYFYQPGRTTHGAPRNRGEAFCSTKCRIGARSAAAADPDFPGYTRSSRHKNSHGYIVRRPAGKRVNGGVLEHTLVMERRIGRKLTRGEQVHHRNGDRTDNRIENLELWDTSQPAGQRAEDKIVFAQGILAKNGLSFHRVTVSEAVSGIAALI